MKRKDAEPLVRQHIQERQFFKYINPALDGVYNITQTLLVDLAFEFAEEHETGTLDSASAISFKVRDMLQRVPLDFSEPVAWKNPRKQPMSQGAQPALR